MAKKLNSRAKGAAAEREAASAIAKTFGVSARRGCQFQGGEDSPDIVSELDVHWECKRVERGNPYDWLAQACRDAGDKPPVVIHRRNNHEWILVMRLADAARVSEALSQSPAVAAKKLSGKPRNKSRKGRGKGTARPAGRVLLARRDGGCDQAAEGHGV